MCVQKIINFFLILKEYDLDCYWLPTKSIMYKIVYIYIFLCGSLILIKILNKLIILLF